MAEIRKTTIPGVGTCSDFATGTGRRLGVVQRASSRRELVVYSRSDPDAVEWSVDLDPEESDILAELLATTSFVQREGSLAGLIEGLALDWIPIPEGFPPTTIGELAIRKRTGATVVATTGPEGPVPAPGPDHVLAPGHTAVVVGTPEGITQVAALLRP
jgi:TrkA domain protein